MMMSIFTTQSQASCTNFTARKIRLGITMNAKVKELGLSEHAHFTNSAGLYDDGNHCTVADMAMIPLPPLECWAP